MEDRQSVNVGKHEEAVKNEHLKLSTAHLSNLKMQSRIFFIPLELLSLKRILKLSYVLAESSSWISILVHDFVR